jgi:hypothetical protein
MSNKTDFERQLMALDQSKLTLFLLGTIEMYLEYIEVHGHSKESAKWAAIREMTEGTAAMIELDDEGAL